MTVYIVLESYAGDPYDIVMVFSNFEDARSHMRKLVLLDRDYTYILESYEVY